MYTYSRVSGLESLLALNAAIQGNNCPDLTRDQSRQNISDNIIRIGKVKSFEKKDENGEGTLNWTTFGSGLQITTNGFIITAAHVIEDWLEDWKRLEESKKDYPNDYDWMNYLQDQYCVVHSVNGVNWRSTLDVSFYCFDKHHDVALVKTIKSTFPQPILFKSGDDSQLWNSYRKRKVVTSLSRNNPDLSLVTSEGYIQNATTVERFYDERNREVYNTDLFTTSIILEGGDSGSPVLSDSGSLLGIAVSTRSIEQLPSKRGYASCAKIKYAFDLVKRTVDEETRKILKY